MLYYKLPKYTIKLKNNFFSLHISQNAKLKAQNLPDVKNKIGADWKCMRSSQNHESS